MRALFFALVLVILLLASCFDKRPADVLPEDKMKTLLTEVHMLDGYLQTLPLDSSQKVIDTLYRQLLSKYNLDSMQFARNVEYYYADPTRTEKIYDQIQKELSDADREFSRADSIRYARERDSLAHVNRLQQQLQSQQNLLQFFKDSTYQFDYDQYRQQLYAPSGLQYLWKSDGQIRFKAPIPVSLPEVPVELEGPTPVGSILTEPQ